MRPAVIKTDLGRLAENYRLIREHAGDRPVMAVVKANAYGHGLVRVAQHYEALGAEWLAVALLEEGIALRKAEVRCPILVFGGYNPKQIPEFLRWELNLTVGSLGFLQSVESVAHQQGTSANIHLKLDSGMGRIGTRTEEAAALIKAAVRSKVVMLRGIYSHLACADDPKHPLTPLQIQRFLEALRIFDDLGESPPMRHLANSGGVLHFPESHLDCIRPGILLYGVYPDPASQRMLPVRPALSLRAEISFVKQIPAGESVSYGATWTASQPTTLATIPVGYGDGYRRHLSNQASVLIQGHRFPIRGRVCMDQFLVDLGGQSVLLGESATLIGEQDSEIITAEELAELCETIPYEILTGLNKRLPRVYQG